MILVLQVVVREEVDEKLHYKLTQVEHRLKSGKAKGIEPFVVVTQTNDGAHEPVVSDTLLLLGEEREEFRQVVKVVKVKGQNYRIVIREALLESDDLTDSISLLFLAFFALFLMVLLLLNYRISKQVWKPFKKNLDNIRRFSLTGQQAFNPDPSNITEFKELNDTLKDLTRRLSKDYNIQKRLTENASHELQTPLAVMRSKIEVILENHKLDENLIEKIKSVYDSINRLSKMNKHLLLLGKIENNQFNQLKIISLEQLLRKKADLFRELAELKGINLNMVVRSDWKLYADSTLMDVLIDNLITNAINHNEKGGEIHILLNSNKLSVSNTAVRTLDNPGRIFERFYKESGASSTGLGLAIVDQVCKVAGLEIQYQHKDNKHFFEIRNATSKSL